MTQRAWMRFSGPTQSLMAEVCVPRTAPRWFASFLKDSSAARELTMDDISVTDWVDALVSTGRPIPISRPLSIESVPVPIFARRADVLKRVEEAKQKKSMTPMRTYTREQIVEMKGSMDADQYESLTSNLTQVDPRILLPDEGHGEEQVVHPVVDMRYDSVQSLRLNPNSFTLFVEVRDREGFLDKQASEAYREQKESLLEGAVAATIAL